MARSNNLIIEGATIMYKNLSGAATQFTPAGQRNFCLVLDEETATILSADGWNIKYKVNRDDYSDILPYVKVDVKFGDYPPRIVMISSKGKVLLNEDTVCMVDVADIQSVDVEVSPYHWQVGSKHGIKAYLRAMYVTIREDALEAKYADLPDLSDDIR